MNHPDYPALDRYWKERRDRVYEEIDFNLKRRGIWISKSLVSDPRAAN